MLVAYVRGLSLRTAFLQMPSRNRGVGALAIGIFFMIFVVGCGADDPEVPPACTDAENAQPRTSCVIEGQTRVTSMGEFGPICSSSCDTLRSFEATGKDVRNLRPLVHIKEIQGWFDIDWIHPSATLEGVENIETIGRVYSEQTNFTIASTGFESLKGFESLREVHGSYTTFIISNNNELEEVDGFPELTTIGGGGLFIESNPQVRKITGFSKLETIEGNLVIWDNANLPRCEAEAFAERIPNIEGEIDIRGGAPEDCN